MLDDKTVKNLKHALSTLNGPQHSASGVSALEPLKQLATSGMDFTIDLKATQNLGAPVILAQPSRNDTWRDQLTLRQQQVASAILCGQSNKQIARDLGISPATVKDHVHAILTRLGLSSRAELIAAQLDSKTR